MLNRERQRKDKCEMNESIRPKAETFARFKQLQFDYKKKSGNSNFSFQMASRRYVYSSR